MRVVLTGASGQLGAYLLERLLAAGNEVAAWSGREAGRRGAIELLPVDLTDAEATDAALRSADPEVIVHAAALSRADEVQRDPARGRAVNVEATRRLAEWCAGRGRRLVYTSTDLVFDGKRAWNREDEPAQPVLEYGRTKREAEHAVLAMPRGLVARVSLLYGPTRSGRPGYHDRAVAAIRDGQPQTFFEDEYRTPLDLATAAEALARLAATEARGLVHVAGAERMSRFTLMRRVAGGLGLDSSLVRANRQGDHPSPEPRPADVSLDSERLVALLPGLSRPPIEEAVVAMDRRP
jgi:dTDP-4-dehydrorhamnose reductase